MSKEVKVKILDMTYDEDNHLFQMGIEELVGDHKKVTLAIRGTDFGIPKGTPVDISQQFCTEMIGKEKNLHIQKDNSVNAVQDVKNNNLSDVHTAYEHAVGFPIDEVVKNIQSKENGDED